MRYLNFLCFFTKGINLDSKVIIMTQHPISSKLTFLFCITVLQKKQVFLKLLQLVRGGGRRCLYRGGRHQHCERQLQGALLCQLFPLCRRQRDLLLSSNCPATLVPCIFGDDIDITLQRNFDLFNPRKGIERPQSQFQH